MDHPDDGYRAGGPVRAVVVKGSDYPLVTAVGSRVRLEIEPNTGRVIVTRGGGALKIAYLGGRFTRKLRSSLEMGFRYTGQIVAVEQGTQGKLLRLELDDPFREPAE